MRRVFFALILATAASSAQAAASDPGSAGLVGSELGPARRREAVPETGVDEKPRRGTFVETTLGIFTTVGGSQPLSNGQAYLGLTFGREVGSAGALFASLGVGASSASCFEFKANGVDCAAADSFGATYLEVGGTYGVQLAPRLLLSGKLVVGLTNLSPAPVTNNDPNKTVADNLFGPHGGVGLGLDYDTHLDHFAVGFDVLGRYSLMSKPGGGSLGLASLAVMPRIRYVF